MSDLFTTQQTAAIIDVVRATMDKTVRETSFVEFIPGTVATFEAQSAANPVVAYVLLDGGGDGVDSDMGAAIPCPVLLPHPLALGDRVMVVFSPPHQHYVIGILQSAGSCPAGSANEVLTPTLDTNLPIPFNPYNEQAGMVWDSLRNGWVVPTKGIYSFSSTLNVDEPECACPTNAVGTFAQSGLNSIGVLGFAVSLDETTLYTLEWETGAGAARWAIFRYNLPALTPMDGGSPWKTRAADDPGGSPLATWRHLTADAAGNLSLLASAHTTGYDKLMRITEAGTVSTIYTESSIVGWAAGTGGYRHAWSPTIGEYVGAGAGPGGAYANMWWRIPDTGVAPTLIYSGLADPNYFAIGAPVVTSDGVWAVGTGNYNPGGGGNFYQWAAGSKLAAPIPKTSGDAGTALMVDAVATTFAASGKVQDGWYCPDGTVTYLRRDTGGLYEARNYDPNTNVEAASPCDLSGLLPNPKATSFGPYYVFQRGPNDVWVLQLDATAGECTLLRT